MKLPSPDCSSMLPSQPPPPPRISGLPSRLHTSSVTENSPVVTAPEIRGQYGFEDLPRDSPTARTSAVEVFMPLPRSPNAVKRSRVSSSAANAKTDPRKRKRYLVGSPALRLMSQMALSPSQRSPQISRSPTGAVIRNSCASEKNDKSTEVRFLERV
ncbi:hypothetical protein ACP4OV_015843 [Aristida adscensionis]